MRKSRDPFSGGNVEVIKAIVWVLACGIIAVALSMAIGSR